MMHADEARSRSRSHGDTRPGLAWLGLLVIGLTSAGCGEAARYAASEPTAEMPHASVAAKAIPEAAAPARLEQTKPGEPAASPPPIMPRRIIYNGTVELAVE